MRFDDLLSALDPQYGDECIDGVVAFVHAKGTSSRVPSKNIRLLGGKPLFCYAVSHALAATEVDKVVVDSDSDQILQIGEEMGALPLRRPSELATNLATGDDLAFWQASNFPRSRIVLQVIPTAPFLMPESIDAIVKMLDERPTLDSVAGVYEDALYVWKNGSPAYYNDDGSIPNSSDMEKIVYETTGIYANQTKAVLETKRRLNPENCAPFFLSKLEAVDINTEEDFKYAELLMRGLRE